MVNNTSVIAIPPGATIKEQLEQRKMSQKEFSIRMDRSEKHISHLISGETKLTHDMALRLESVLGIPAQFWNNLEANYRGDLEKMKAEKQLIDDVSLAASFPYSKMAKYGWIPTTQDKKEKAINLRKFFEVVELGLLNDLKIPGIAYRKVGDGIAGDYALMAWAQKAKLEARNINTKPINIDQLKKYVPKFRDMTTKNPASFCSELIDLLASCGVALVFLPHIGGSFLHGASFYDGDHIVLGLTVRGKDADRFWFSFFHELSHIISGDITSICITTTEQGDCADLFARDTLISQSDYDRLVQMQDFSKRSIINFAKSINILPGIVVGRLQKENLIDYSWHNDLKVRYEIKD